MGLAGNAGHKNEAKSRHVGTIAQLCRALSSQLRHVSTIGITPVKQQYRKILEDEGSLNPSQHGFMKKRSCLTNLLECFEEWTKALDEGYGIDVIYLDYRKAFDSVPHK